MGKVSKFVKFVPVPIGAKEAAAVPMMISSPTKLVEAQVGQDLEICEVHIGTAVLSGKAWEGREVEAGVRVSVIMKNVHENEVRYSEGGWFVEVEEAPAPFAVGVAAAVTEPTQVPLPHISDAVVGFPQHHPPPPPEPLPIQPQPAWAQPGSPTNNPHPCSTPNGATPVYPGQNEVAVCLTTEQAKRVLFVLKGGMLHPLEVYGIQGPFERALRNVGIAP
jgi:hypothetical protein